MKDNTYCYYNRQNNSLIFTKNTPSSKFWDELWDSNDFVEQIENIDLFIVKWTRRYLSKGTRVLDGGCGRGSKVYSLYKAGYNAFGIDFAHHTIKKIKKNISYLDVMEGNLLHLPFSDNCFDGYWSLGVIEHYYRGYDKIIKEMRRVIRPGGYLFMTFPYMSPFRRFKVKHRFYDDLPNGFDPLEDNFYQFALDDKKVIDELNRYNFRLVNKVSHDGLKGIKDEIKMSKPILQLIYDSRKTTIQFIRKSMNLLLTRKFGHIILLVLKNCK